MRSIWTGLLSALLALTLAHAAWAQNGLQRFETDIKPQFELKSFTYSGAAPVGDTGCSPVGFDGVKHRGGAACPGSALVEVLDQFGEPGRIESTVGAGDKETTLKIKKVTVDALDFDRLKKDAKDDQAPRFAKIKLEGLTGDDELFTALEPYGVPHTPVDVALDYKLDETAKTLDLKTLEINLPGQAKVALSLVLENISDKPSQMAGAKDDGRLRTASLTIDDSGLLAKLLPVWAKQENVSADEMVQTGLMGLGAFAAQQGPDTLKQLDAVASFLTDWKAPKGPLVLGLKPAKTAGLADLDKLGVALMPLTTGELHATAHREYVSAHLLSASKNAILPRRPVRMATLPPSVIQKTPRSSSADSGASGGGGQ